MIINIPVILLKELIILPNQEIKIELKSSLSSRIIKEATLKNDGTVLVVAPKNETSENPSVDDLPKVGVIAKIKNRIVLPNDNIRITLRGLKRVAIKSYYTKKESEDILYGECLEIALPKYDRKEELAIRRKLMENLNAYIEGSSSVSNSILGLIKQTSDLDKITDMITSFLPFTISKKLEYMQNINPLTRAIHLIKDLESEIKYNKIDEQLDDAVSEEMNVSQRNFILKEKLKVIKKELGENSLHEEETKKYRSLLSKHKLSAQIKEKINGEITKFETMPEASPEISVLRNYLDWILNLPWNKLTKEELRPKVVEETLNESHYGLVEIKTRIIEYVKLKKISPSIKSPILCLIGPPGIGKTTIAMSVAKSLNREFYKISVGGLNDSTELIGSRRTYLAANPGKIIQGIRKCGSKNPVILIDEVDKMIRDYKGDPASTLLEILDPTQNKFFTDNYLEEPFDLSEVLFILTANESQSIPLTLIDRVEQIELNSYTIFEKKDIAKKYLIPRICREYKIASNRIKLTDDIIYFIINAYTKEAGIRDLERNLLSLIRKILIQNIKNMTKEKVVKLLGTPKYLEEDFCFASLPGVVNTLAVSNAGGTVTKLEVIKYKGSGVFITTGQIGKVMEESIKVVMSYLKNEFNYNLSNFDFHFHFLDATTKKDGPSAGVSTIVGLISNLEKKAIPSDVAFTGEISLTGNILKVGGIKEKIIGAYNKGIKKIYIPRSNEPDLKEIPSNVLEDLEIISVINFRELYTTLFKK